MKKKNIIRLLLLVVPISVIVLLAVPSSRASIIASVNSAYAQVSPGANSAFPNIEMRKLSNTQRMIVQITRQEYAERPTSYDRTVLKYTDGNKEPWCADFTSWVMKQSGVPYKNQNSTSWRIPGVLTLQEYYKSENRYIKADGKYRPKVGDVAIYVGERTLDGRSRQHANIVLDTIGDNMVTIGGNEQGRMRVSMVNFKTNESSLVGFGTLPKPVVK